MSRSCTAVLFDVDGTLIDTTYLHAVTWWEAFAQADLYVPMSRIHRRIGMGADQMLDDLLPGDRDRDGDEALAAAHDALYSVYWSRLSPLPGAADLVRACHKAGLRVVLASSAGPRELKILRAVLDADEAIGEATSAGDADQSKPAPDLVQVALERAGVPPEEAVFVGDAVWDVKACQKVGVPCVGVLSGGVSASELTEAGAVAVYDSPADILAGFPATLTSAT